MTAASLHPYVRNHQPALLIMAAIVFMLVFSAAFLFGKSLRLDETQSLWQTSHSMGGVLRILAQDVHLPVYFIMLRSWEALFGSNALAIRSFSFLFLAASVPAVYALARRVYSEPVAMLSVFLVAVSPFLLWYGSEGRMYTLLLFFTIVNQLAFVRLWQPHPATPADWTLYATSAVLGTMTHYFFLFVLVVQAIFFCLNRRVFGRRALGAFAFVAGLVLVECLGWFVFRTTVGKIDADPFLAAPSSIDVFNVFSSFFLGFQSRALNTVVLSLWPIVILLAFTLLSRVRIRNPETQYLLMSGLLPILIAFVASWLLRPLFLPRYLIIALPSLYILAAHFILAYGPNLAKGLAVTTVAFMQTGSFVQALSPAVVTNEDYRGAAHYLETQARPDDLVVATAPFTRYPMEYYYDGQARLSTFPVWERYLELPAIPPYTESDLAAAVADWKTKYTLAYVLTSYDQGYEEQLRLYLDHHLERVSSEEFSPGLHVYVYRLRYL